MNPTNQPPTEKNMDKEKRVFSRIAIQTKTTLMHKKKSYPVQLKNLSLQGATIETTDNIALAKGNSCVLKIIPGESDSSLDLDAMAMYCDDGNIGVQFSENSPQTVKKLRLIISSNFDKKQN